jgi:hypothetical protein
MSKAVTNQLVWHVGGVNALADILVDAEIQKSLAVGDLTIYHFQHNGSEKMAVTLPDGQSLMISLAARASHPARRRQDVNN